MKISTRKFAIVSALVALIIGVLTIVFLENRASVTVDQEDCALVLGASGLYCGPRILGHSIDGRLRLSEEDWEAALASSQDEPRIVVRAEVPYHWLQTLFENLERSGVEEFSLLLEDSVCGSESNRVHSHQLAAWDVSIHARAFNARIAPRREVAFEGEEAIVRVHTLGFEYEVGSARLPSMPDCNKKLFTFCDPDAEPNEFLASFSELRSAAQKDEDDPLATGSSYEHRRRETAKFARNQYPLETMRGQLEDRWPDVQLNVLDSLPMAVILEVIDALVYERHEGERKKPTHNIPNDLELRCQGSPKKNVYELMLTFSDEQGVILTEQEGDR